MSYFRKTTIRQCYKFVHDADGKVGVVPMNPGGVPRSLLAHARADALETARDIVDRAKESGGSLTAEESSAVESLKREIHRIDAVLRGGEVCEPSSGTVNDWMNHSGQMTDTPSGPYPAIPSYLPTKTYRQIFGASQESLSMDGFSSAAEYFDLLRKGVPDSRFVAASSFTGSTGSGGGYSLPSAISATLLDSLLEASVILPRSTIIPMDDRKVSVWGFDSLDQSTAHQVMGINFEVVAEGGSVTPTAGKVRGVSLEARKLMAITKISLELLDDSARFEQALRDNFSRAAAWVVDDYLINGDGTDGEFLGILNCPSKIAIDSTGQTTGTFTLTNAINMRARLMEGGSPIWIVNQDVLPQLYSMTLADAGLVMAFDGKELLGIPVVVSSKAQSISTEGDVILADLSRFLIGMRKEIVIESSPHFAFDSGEVAFRLILRLDSADSMSAAMTPRYSSDTLGWAITLQTRTT